MRTDITQEVWEAIAEAGSTGPRDHHVMREDGEIIAHVFNLGQGLSEPFAMMLARAPTMFRLLEEVLQSCDVPDDLREVIEINLHRAAPEKYRSPERRVLPPAWTRLLDRDDVFGERRTPRQGRP
jgi:hypothetical protein